MGFGHCSCVLERQASLIAMAGGVRRFSKLPWSVNSAGCRCPRRPRKSPEWLGLVGLFGGVAGAELAVVGKRREAHPMHTARPTSSLRSQARDAVNQVGIPSHSTDSPMLCDMNRQSEKVGRQVGRFQVFRE